MGHPPTGSDFPQRSQAKLTASDAAANAFFGSSVALSGDGNTALIGTPYSTGRTGAAYVFTRSGSTWTQQAKLTTGVTNDNFGWSTALSGAGNTAIVGATLDNGQGAAYVFTRSGSTWTQQAKITASGGGSGDQFGYSAAVSQSTDSLGDGSTALIGARGKNGFTGQSFVFTRSGSTWTQQVALIASDGATGDEFGNSVGLSGDGNTADIGAAAKNNLTGAAYVFSRSGSTWTQIAKVTASGGVVGDWFGFSAGVSGNGSAIPIGAIGPNGFTGKTYVAST